MRQRTALGWFRQRKRSAAPALPGYPGHVLADSGHTLVFNAKASASGMRAERDAVAKVLADSTKPGKRVMVVAGGRQQQIF